MERQFLQNFVKPLHEFERKSIDRRKTILEGFHFTHLLKKAKQLNQNCLSKFKCTVARYACVDWK